ncbi:MAG: 50S ribosomal protein L15 [Bacillota bacterium]
MKLHELAPAPGARRPSRRVGRGIGSGRGKTAGRGHKGQNARAGGGVRPGFEGGQMPLYRRLPMRGFTNPFRREFAEVNVGALTRFPAGTVITPDLLLEHRLVREPGAGVVVLGNGTVDRPLTVQAHRFSRSAAEKLVKAGGKAEVI